PGAADERFNYHTDALGSVVAITSEAGTVVATYRYGAFGELLATGGSDAALAARNPLRYRAYYYDTHSALPARYYDPASARFLSPDPAPASAGDPRTLDRYMYCTGDPVNYCDRTGAVTDVERDAWAHYYYDDRVTGGIRSAAAAATRAVHSSVAARRAIGTSAEAAAAERARIAAEAAERERALAERERVGQLVAGSVEFLAGSVLVGFGEMVMGQGAVVAAAGAIGGSLVELGAGTAGGASAGFVLIGIGAGYYTGGSLVSSDGSDRMLWAVGLRRPTSRPTLEQWGNAAARGDFGAVAGITGQSLIPYPLSLAHSVELP
ncbi:MAG: RHS repeat-associated core domain-containing protein, partial [Coriobacteriia bacterium]|nr:RHS repeat-associated core domain-containing protein [Coriobacteriia bacterium]